MNNISLTYIITTNKNIRCYGCAQDCEKFQAETYVDVDSFRNNIKRLKQIFLEPFILKFGGGEPLLHKQLYNLCQIVNEELPKTKIEIHTNGILLNTIKDNQLLELNKNNVEFYLYLYPIFTYAKTYEKQMKRFQELGIPMHWSHEHLYFNKFSLIRKTHPCSKSIENQMNLMIKDDYFYVSCPAIQDVEYRAFNKKNCIAINDVININQIFNLFKDVDCSHCKNNAPLSELYINDYDRYEALTSYVYDIGSFLQNPLFFENIKKATSTREFDSLLTRCVNGWLDIYIPFSKETSESIDFLKFKTQLLMLEGIENCNLYFVSIDNDIETQQKWFNVFNNYNDFRLNTYFLKGNSLYLGEKKFFEQSRIVNHYILDINNLSILDDPLFLTHILKGKRR